MGVAEKIRIEREWGTKVHEEKLGKRSEAGGLKTRERTVQCSHMVYISMSICIYIYGRISTDGVINNIFMQNPPNLYFLVKLQTDVINQTDKVHSVTLEQHPPHCLMVILILFLLVCSLRIKKY